jgi:hypothetical protein
VKKRISTVPLYAAFLVWGAGALDAFITRGNSVVTYTLMLTGMVCLLVYYCVKNIETRLAAVEAEWKLLQAPVHQNPSPPSPN